MVYRMRRNRFVCFITSAALLITLIPVQAFADIESGNNVDFNAVTEEKREENYYALRKDDKADDVFSEIEIATRSEIAVYKADEEIEDSNESQDITDNLGGNFDVETDAVEAGDVKQVLLTSMAMKSSSKVDIDYIRPTIKDIHVDVAGETIQKGETVHATTKVTDAGGIASVTLCFNRTFSEESKFKNAVSSGTSSSSSHSSSSSSSATLSDYATDEVEMTYNKESGLYEGEYTFTDDDPSGEYVPEVCAIDNNENIEHGYGNSQKFTYVEKVSPFRPEITDITVEKAGEIVPEEGTVHVSAKVSVPEDDISKVSAVFERVSYYSDATNIEHPKTTETLTHEIATSESSSSTSSSSSHSSSSHSSSSSSTMEISHTTSRVVLSYDESSETYVGTFTFSKDDPAGFYMPQITVTNTSGSTKSKSSRTSGFTYIEKVSSAKPLIDEIRVSGADETLGTGDKVHVSAKVIDDVGIDSVTVSFGRTTISEDEEDFLKDTVSFVTEEGKSSSSEVHSSSSSSHSSSTSVKSYTVEYSSSYPVVRLTFDAETGLYEGDYTFTKEMPSGIYVPDVYAINTLGNHDSDTDFNIKVRYLNDYSDSEDTVRNDTSSSDRSGGASSHHSSESGRSERYGLGGRENIVRIASWMKKVDGNWNLLKPDGVPVTGFAYAATSKGNRWFFFEPDGVMKTGWVLNHGKWYYLCETKNADEGAALSGFIQDPNSKYFYYLDPTDYAMKTGWIKLDGAYHFFNDSLLSELPYGAMMY